MATRAPERGGLERRQVARAEVLVTDATGFLARTEAYPDPWPTGPFPAPPDRSRPAEGRLRIEAVADTVLRVRYAPGSQVRDGGQHMLVGALSRATKARSATWRLGDQFLCGRSILAAPLFEPGGGRRAYLPAGTWTDWWTRERVRGPRWVPASHGLGTMPLYLREGAVIPMGPVTQWVGERPCDPLTLVVAPFEADGRPGEVVLDAPTGAELAS
jgi:hypothetical protein